MRRLFMLAMATVGSLLFQTEAEACSCRSGVFEVSPGDGAVNVPLNAEIKLAGATFGLEASTAKLESEGVDVPLDVVLQLQSYARLRPRTPLKPLTTYTITHPDGVAATFSTSAETDDVPPSSAVVGTVERLDTSLTSFGSSCGPTKGYRFTFEPGVDDRTPPADLWHHVYVSLDGSGGGMTEPATAASGGTVFFGQSACSDSPVDDRMIVRFAAVDYAGNEAAPTEPLPAPSCGCSAASAAGPAWSIVLLFGVFVYRRLQTSSIRAS